jgi:phytoene dehydrogenase-like protein
MMLPDKLQLSPRERAVWDTRGDVIIIGGGIAGLSCALHLLGNGFSPLVLEASTQLGGRMRTDTVDGFLLDHGLHLFLPADTEARNSFHLPALHLRPLAPGARIRYGERFHRVVHPFRDPGRTRRAFLSTIGTLGDKVRMVALRARLIERSALPPQDAPRSTTMAFLREFGFSSAIIDRFFRPLLATFFHERDLETSSHTFELVARALAVGDAALPAAGIGSIARQLADRLPAGTIRTQARVERVLDREVRLDSGELLRSDAIVVATNAPDAGALTGQIMGRASYAATTLSFAAAEPPFRKPVLLLNGDGTGPVNSICVPSQIAPSYAPAGRALVVASVVGSPLANDELLERAVRTQLRGWFGRGVDEWRLLRIRRIAYAVPSHTPRTRAGKLARIRPGLFICGDHCESGTMHGALRSGRRAAEAVALELSGAAVEEVSD